MSDDLVKRLRNTGSMSHAEVWETFEEAADRIKELEAKLTGAVAECDRIGRLWHDAEAKLEKVKAAFRINMMHALPNYTHEMFDKDYAEMMGETDD